MGDRYYITVVCECGYKEDDVYYAPTCGFLYWTCPKCKKEIDLEENSGIDAEGCASTQYGIDAVQDLKKSKDKDVS